MNRFYICCLFGCGSVFPGLTAMMSGSLSVPCLSSSGNQSTVVVYGAPAGSMVLTPRTLAEFEATRAQQAIIDREVERRWGMLQKKRASLGFAPI